MLSVITVSHDSQMSRLDLWPCVKCGSNMGVLVGVYKSKARLMCELGHGNKRTLWDKHRSVRQHAQRACVGNACNILQVHGRAGAQT